MSLFPLSFSFFPLSSPSTLFPLHPVNSSLLDFHNFTSFLLIILSTSSSSLSHSFLLLSYSLFALSPSPYFQLHCFFTLFFSSSPVLTPPRFPSLPYSPFTISPSHHLHIHRIFVHPLPLSPFHLSLTLLSTLHYYFLLSHTLPSPLHLLFTFIFTLPASFSFF